MGVCSLGSAYIFGDMYPEIAPQKMFGYKGRTGRKTYIRTLECCDTRDRAFELKELKAFLRELCFSLDSEMPASFAASETVAGDDASQMGFDERADFDPSDTGEEVDAKEAADAKEEAEGGDAAEEADAEEEAHAEEAGEEVEAVPKDADTPASRVVAEETDSISSVNEEEFLGKHPEVLNPPLPGKAKRKRTPAAAAKGRGRKRKYKESSSSSSTSSVSWKERKRKVGKKRKVGTKGKKGKVGKNGKKGKVAESSSSYESSDESSDESYVAKRAIAKAVQSSSDDDAVAKPVARKPAEHSSTDDDVVAQREPVKAHSKAKLSSSSSDGMAENLDAPGNEEFFSEMSRIKQEKKAALRNLLNTQAEEAKRDAKTAELHKQTCYRQMYAHKECLENEAKELLKKHEESHAVQARLLATAFEEMLDEVRKKYGGNTVLPAASPPVSESRAYATSVGVALSSVPDDFRGGSVREGEFCPMPALPMPDSPGASSSQGSALPDTNSQLIVVVKAMAMRKEQEASAAGGVAKSDAVYTQQRAAEVAQQLYALGSQKVPAPVAPGLTRFGNPRRKPKLTSDQRIAINQERRRISDRKEHDKDTAKKARAATTASNKQAIVDRANRYKINKQIRWDEKHGGVAGGNSDSEDAQD